MTREEAINKIRQMSLPQETMEILQALAPELTESEDERIYNEIMEFFRMNEKRCIVDNSYTKWIAWLEKQKEQKPTAEEVLVKAGLKPFKDGNQWCILAGDNIQEGICGFGDTIDDALYDFLMDVLNMQKEQKPTINIKHLKSYMLQYLQDAANRKDDSEIEADTDKWAKKIIELMGIVEQKPAEWSEEDKVNLKRAINICVNDFGEESKTAQFLKSLPERFNLPYKQDWSEEDKKMIERLITRLNRITYNTRTDGTSPNITFFEEIAWLKSLRPQPHWNPTEEQMEVLLNAEGLVRANNYPENAKILASLYEQLKKLM